MVGKPSKIYSSSNSRKMTDLAGFLISKILRIRLSNELEL